MTKKKSLKTIPISIDRKEVFTNYNKQMQSLTDTITEYANKINTEKERLVIERIKAIMGEDIDLKKETQRMFPRIARKISQIDKTEAFFWNDGTEFGKLIITFYSIEEIPQFTEEDMIIKVNFGFKYK